MNLPENRSNSFCLVVEDCDADYVVLERFVRRSQLPVSLRRCVQGEEIMSMLKASEAPPFLAEVPSVIVLDLGLSGADDGRAVLQAIRRHPDLKRTPVVVFSASTDPADIDWCYRQGANAYQVKNMDFMSFQCVAELLVEYWRGAGASRLAMR